MHFPILTSHLSDTYTIGRPSDRKEFLAALTAANTAWQERCVTPTLLRSTKEGFNRALQIAWLDLQRTSRDPAARMFWQRFASAPEVQSINGYLKTARLAPNDTIVREKVIDFLREVLLLNSIVRNLQSLSRQ